MKKSYCLFLYMAFSALAVMPKAHAASVFADSLVASQYVTPFGSGIVTGPPDGGGLFLSDTFDPPAHLGYIVVHFGTPLFDGPGADIRVYDVANSVDEVVNISVSADGANFTPVGSLNSVANTLDISGLFSGPFSFVRIANASTTSSMDVDAVEGLNTNAVPEPTPLTLYTGGLAGLLFLARKYRFRSRGNVKA